MRPISAADLAQEAIDGARRQAPADRLRAGLDLFDRTCRLMADGIRHEHPHADEQTVLRILRERLRLARELEQR